MNRERTSPGRGLRCEEGALCRNLSVESSWLEELNCNNRMRRKEAYRGWGGRGEGGEFCLEKDMSDTGWHHDFEEEH